MVAIPIVKPLFLLVASNKPVTRPQYFKCRLSLTLCRGAVTGRRINFCYWSAVESFEFFCLTLDVFFSFSIRLGLFLRRYPVARLFVIIYMVKFSCFTRIAYLFSVLSLSVTMGGLVFSASWLCKCGLFRTRLFLLKNNYNTETKIIQIHERHVKVICVVYPF